MQQAYAEAKVGDPDQAMDSFIACLAAQPLIYQPGTRWEYSHSTDVVGRISLAPSPAVGYGFGLGFAVRTAEGRSPVPGNVGDYFWAGAYGTYFWVDPKEELYAVLMLQGPSDRIQYRYRPRCLSKKAAISVNASFVSGRRSSR